MKIYQVCGAPNPFTKIFCNWIIIFIKCTKLFKHIFIKYSLLFLCLCEKCYTIVIWEESELNFFYENTLLTVVYLLHMYWSYLIVNLQWITMIYLFYLKSYERISRNHPPLLSSAFKKLTLSQLISYEVSF